MPSVIFSEFVCESRFVDRKRRRVAKWLLRGGRGLQARIAESKLNRLSMKH